jgi:quinol monooxygenase YgiN
VSFVVTATWRAKPGEADKILAVLRIMAPHSRAEPGNQFYAAQVAPTDPDVFFLYEQYVDEEAYEAHKASSYFQEHVLKHALNYLAEREVKTFLTLDL